MAFVIPFLAFMIAVFLIPLLMIVFYSLGASEMTLSFYDSFFRGLLYRQVLLTTIEISVVSALLTLLIAYPVAFHLSKQPFRRRIILAMLLLLPFYTSILVKSFAFTVLLGHSGIANNVIRAFFGPDAALPLLFNRVGVYIGLTHNLLPFMVFPILTNLLAQDRNLPRAAEVMGAGRLRIFWRITFPLSLPGVMVGILLAIILTMGQFITPALLGGRKDLMMANLIHFQISHSLEWNMAATISVVLLFFSGVLILALSRVRGVSLFESRAV